MYSRLSRLLLAFVLFVGLVLSLSASATRTSSLSALQGSNIQPDGYGIATGHRVSTVTVPQARDTSSMKEMYHSATSEANPTSLRASIPYTPNVVNVPPATITDPTAMSGIADGGMSANDPNGAGGTDNFIEEVSREFAIYSRGGIQQYETTYKAWFANVEGKATTFYNPNVIWDSTGNRFLIIVDTGISLLLSVAQQSDATSGDFCNYSFPTTPNLGADYDKLGVNSSGVYFTANEVAGGNLYNNILFFANRLQLESCANNVNYTTWTNLRNGDGSIAQAIVPAVQDTASQGKEYFVNSHQNGGCTLTLWTLVTSTSTLNRTPINTQCYSPAPNAPQAGSSATIYTGDSSVNYASYINGSLTLALQGSYDWGDGNGPVGIIEWFVLNPLTATLYNQGSFGTPGYWLFYPAVIRNFQGRMIFVYDACGPTIDPSIWYVNQTFKNPMALAQGVSYYGSSGKEPWVEYQSAWLDTAGSNPNAVWITGMYANATDSWGTEFDLVTP